MGDSRIKDVSSLLSTFFDADKLRRGERYSDFYSSWPRIVGTRLAAHSHVADVDKGLLVVEAEHPGWIQLLQVRQSSILGEVSKCFPELGLKGIVFRLSGNAGATAPPAVDASIKTRPEPDKDELDALAGPETVKRLEGINDPEFRNLLSSLRETILGKE
jgi:hypothetical protein